MSFVSSQIPGAPFERPRWAILASVALLHAGAFYGLVVGLAGVVTFIDKTPPLTAHDDPVIVPIASPSTPKARHETPRRETLQPVDSTAVAPQVTPLAIPTPELEPIDDGMLRQALADGDARALPTPRPSPSSVARQARPRGMPGTWISPNDYPAQDLREGNSGAASFRLAIGSDGYPQSCTIIASSGHPGLDAATCQFILRRAHFVPAVDDGGGAVAGSYQGKVIWTIPEH